MNRPHHISALRASLLLAMGAAWAHPAAAQSDVRFSMDWRGPTQGLLGLSDGDILEPPIGGPASPATSPPTLSVSGLALGLTPLLGCSAAPGVPCGASLDALSYGIPHFPPSAANDSLAVLFSVDRHAQGINFQSDLWVEASTFDQGSDIFASEWYGSSPPAVTGANRLWLDGDGITNIGLPQPGIGFKEPNDPAAGWPGAAHDAGDDLDAFDFPTSPGADDPVYFSVPSGFVDPADPVGAPAIPSTSLALGVSGADVLYGGPNLAPTVYASAFELGLDRMGSNTDDIDALHISEDGVPGFRGPAASFEWGPGVADLVLFSLRRGSATIGRIDSRLGLPITEGDLLTAPSALGSTPEIIVRAEDMGLRADRGGDWPENDDLDGATVTLDPFEFTDCNGNNIDDVEDIRDEVSDDTNNNGIPDECEYPGTVFCNCTASAAAPCTVVNEEAGCGNSVGPGASLQSYGLLTNELGLNFRATELPPLTLCWLRVSETTITPLAVGAGVRCLGHRSKLLLAQYSDFDEGTATARCQFAPQYLETWQPGLEVAMGQTLYFQVIYKDASGDCGKRVNFTNGVSVMVE